MKGVSASGRKNINQMLKRVQHDKRVWVSLFVIPNQVLNLIQDLRFRDLGFCKSVEDWRVTSSYVIKKLILNNNVIVSVIHLISYC